MDRRSMARLVCALSMGMAGLAYGQQQGTVTYVYTDPQGTPLAEADANGNITATYDYTPYGTTAMGTPPNGPGYTGHVNDPETNLTYMQARYYDPATGHFLSVDPDTPTAGNGFNFNRYAYASNNPIVNTDPTGKDVVFSVDPNGAGGNGHTTLYFQDGQGQWYSFNQGAQGATSSGGNAGFLLGQNAPAGVTISPVSSNKVPGSTASTIVIKTTSDQDAKIAASAQASADAYNSGELKYNIYTNSCTVASVDVVNNSGTGITVSDPTFTFRPNSWIRKVKNNPKAVKQTTPPPPQQTPTPTPTQPNPTTPTPPPDTQGSS